jgi:hypothetical protein
MRRCRYALGGGTVALEPRYVETAREDSITTEHHHQNDHQIFYDAGTSSPLMTNHDEEE